LATCSSRPTKGIIRSRKSTKHRKDNDQEKKDKQLFTKHYKENL
jgi:hypothetical protein